MKKLILSLVGLLALCPQDAGARSYKEIMDKTVIRVGVFGDLPPFSMATQNVFVGFEPELARAMLKDFGANVNFVRLSGPNDLTRALANDEVDMALGGFEITSTNEKFFDFSNPYMCSGISVISLNPSVTKHTDFAGKKIAVVKDSLQSDFVKKLPFDKTVLSFPSVFEVTQAVLSGQADATLGWAVMEPTIKKMYPQVKAYFGPEMYDSPIGIAFQEGNTTLKNVVNARLLRFMGTAEYQALSQKYFGKSVRCRK